MSIIAQDNPLLVQKQDGILRLTLNRPEALNAFTRPMMEGLAVGFKDAAVDASIRVVILTGTGRAFCVGQDLKEHISLKPSFLKDLRERYNPLVLAIRNLEKPVVAVINGVAAGAGMSLALACDFRICSESTSFHTAFVKIGLAPDSGNLFFLSRYVGAARALELVMTGRPLLAKEAQEWGLVNRVVPPDQLEVEATKFAKQLADSPAVALALIKRMFNATFFSKDMASQLEMEAYLQEIVGRTKDHAEGLQTFLEKRQPRFTGQ
ncbi:MAG: enoyl-CoA hydratase/isomerase family protein [Elusimicrobia bacterium]|nr:enoyl-CoA hydratase/isomerase family protein [Elusimicrobiota bacterium]